MEVNDLYMTRCLELARCGAGYTAPNPMVGAVVVHDGRIIGEGFHRQCGEAHAEVNAIAAVKDESLLRDSTLYVSLEPCSHYGKTPPCAELIIRKKIPRVVVACLDPFPAVAGRGVKMLRDAGVKVVTGVMEAEAIALNCFFMTAHTKHRPYIILKWAQSADGYIDRIRKNASEKPVVFSNKTTARMVHKLRSEVQAIMVGTNTALLDNPSLTVRYWTGKSPLRILIDRNLRVPESLQLFDGSQPTIVYTTKRLNVVKRNVEYVVVSDSPHFLREIMINLYERNIHSILVEGGAQLHRSFLESGLWDSMVIEKSLINLGEGVKAVGVDACYGAQLVEKKIISSCMLDGVGDSLIEVYANSNI